MKLIDFLAVCGEENTVVVLENSTGRYLAEYDGKDSIDEAFNDCKVIDVGGSNYLKIVVRISLEEDR